MFMFCPFRVLTPFFLLDLGFRFGLMGDPMTPLFFTSESLVSSTSFRSVFPVPALASELDAEVIHSLLFTTFHLQPIWLFILFQF